MVCSGSRNLNFRPIEQKFARKIRSIGGNYIFGHKTKSKWGICLFNPWGKLIGEMGSFVVGVAGLPTMDDGRRRVRP